MKNLSLVFVAGLSFAAAGCKKSGGADCAKAVNHSMELSKAEMQKMGTDAAMMQKMVDLGIQRCKDDKWSADATKCMIDAKTMTDAQGCYGKLTKEQQDKMNKAAMELAMPSHGEGDTAGSAEAGSAGGAMGSAGGAGGSDMGSAGAGSAAAGSAGGAAGSGSAAAGSARDTGSGSAGSAAAPK